MSTSNKATEGKKVGKVSKVSKTHDTTKVTKTKVIEKQPVNTINNDPNYFDTHTMHVVHMRSMTVYEDHNHKDLQEGRNKRTFTPIAFFTSYESAEKWLIEHGTALEEEYVIQFDQPCVFCIISAKNLLPGSDEFDGDMETCEGNTNLYWSNRGHPTYAFSKESHQMTLDENYIFCSHDWGHPVFDDIFYVKSKKIYYACTEKHFKKCLKDMNYNKDYIPTLQKQWDDFKVKAIGEQKYFLDTKTSKKSTKSKKSKFSK